MEEKKSICLFAMCVFVEKAFYTEFFFFPKGNTIIQGIRTPSSVCRSVYL